MNPYPDYAFTFGPVRFISLDHKWEMAGGGALRSSFTQEQLAFLREELSGTETNLTTVMFHDHWRAFGLDDYDFTLTLAGHNHNNLAYRLHGGSLLLVTGAPPRTDDMIRVIEFGEDRILSCSYHADDLASAIPARLVGVEVSPATGGEFYQRLVVENGLDRGLYNACWTFNLTGPGEDWKPLVLGGSLDSILATNQSTYCRARFDLPPRSRQMVECFSLIPATLQAATDLSRMIDEGVAVAESLKSFLEENAASFGDQLEDALDSLATARMALDEGNWTLGGILFSRATHVINPIQLLAQSLRDVESEIGIRQAQGMYTSPTDAWIQEAFLLLAQQGLHPSLMDTRKETPTPMDQMARILNLDEAGWELVDQIGRLNQSIAKAMMEGEDMRIALGDLKLAAGWLDLGYFSMSRQTLERIRANFPNLFVAEYGQPIVLLLTLLSAFLLWLPRTREAANMQAAFPHHMKVGLTPANTGHGSEHDFHSDFLHG